MSGRGRGLAPVLLKRAATVSPDRDIRQRSRFQATDSLARPIGVFLPRDSVVRGTDVLSPTTDRCCVWLPRISR